MTDDAKSDDGIVARVVGWLRAGYPDGVPEEDYVALLGILQRSLTPSEIAVVVDGLVADAATLAADGLELEVDAVRRRIEELLQGPALPSDVARVAGRLASAGWPLGRPIDDAPAPGDRVGLVTRVVRWLREGYPMGLPENDFIPLVALLRRRLTDAEVIEVAARLSAEGALPPTRVDVGSAIAEVTSALPSEDDIERVRRSLVEHGWPVDFPV
ncbi:DUF3349 domain-containing protein [Herbiconiux sp. L3-i23]|uniref:DUF3349 domain-containing protein n=1 Tax=Herbiconiux sp. L3-i23 TaxID=2905871 RepID=UPI0020688B91|nr:DUF3349 domain-containing protein [Herbiconiux sp. L3-i23]BDI22879.1 hypothetical protein L3i23_16550 [Herbiconiux sp. L3-i23]